MKDTSKSSLAHLSFSCIKRAEHIASKSNNLAVSAKIREKASRMRSDPLYAIVR